MEMSIRHPLLLPTTRDLLKNPKGEIHPLVQNKSLRLVAWTVSGKSYLQKEYQQELQSSSLKGEEWGQTLITNRPGESGLIGVINEKLIPLDVL